MERPSYLSKYMFDWEMLDVIISGKSALDSASFIGPMFTMEQVREFLKAYGLEPNSPIYQAELFGNFQEALQFVRRYFLKEGNAEGLDLKIPNRFYTVTDVSELFLMATGNAEDTDTEERLWAEVIIKIMHTILHIDKDMRFNYFTAIQTQIFDRFYKHVRRDDNDRLFLGKGEHGIELVDFETKSKKTRDSVIIKLLHKPENVAEELFDRVGIRFVTKRRLDTLRVVKFLIDKNVIIPHNIKPSRSVNTILDVEAFRRRHQVQIKNALRRNISEDEFIDLLEKETSDCPVMESDGDNTHSLPSYQSIQFTCRHLIKYKNPFFKEFKVVREIASKESEENELAKKILQMDVSSVAKDLRFFYPYEVQVVDEEGHRVNTEGEASHVEYKKSQVRSAMHRIFAHLIKYKGVDVKPKEPRDD